jgi:hypothetical protein
MKKEIEEITDKLEQLFILTEVTFELNLDQNSSKETRKKIRKLISKEMKGIYIISENNQLKDILYVGQSATCIRKRILIHLDAIEDKKSAHKSYRKFFKDYVESNLHITILPIYSENKIKKETELLLKYKEAVLTYKHRPKFVF